MLTARISRDCINLAEAPLPSQEERRRGNRAASGQLRRFLAGGRPCGTKHVDAVDVAVEKICHKWRCKKHATSGASLAGSGARHSRRV